MTPERHHRPTAAGSRASRSTVDKEIGVSARWLSTTLLLLFIPCGIVAQADSVLLDGPCIDRLENFSEEMSVVRAQAEAVRRGNLEAAVRLQKERVRLMCDNAWRWFGLANLYMKRGDTASAVRIVDHVESWAANTVQRARDAHESVLAGLWESEAFRGSSLARRMEERRAEHRRRIHEGRSRLETVSSRPPADYVVEEACPFECCVYRRWSVLEETRLYASIGSDSMVATVAAGDTVEGRTGQVHLRPVPVFVIHRPAHQERVSAGDVLFLLDYRGEGFSHVWFEGDVLTMQTRPEVRTYCPVPGPDCWGEYLNDAGGHTDETYVWWVQVDTVNGRVGWTAESDHFGNMDACG